MATQVATTVTKAVAPLPRKFGKKQLFLPNHVIAFIRPKPKQPPNLATFVVPLTFNKLDLADYLKHAYDVEVLSVRSWVNQKLPVRKGGYFGRWYRPRSEKMMIAELVKPFVWPDAPAVEDREGFDHKVFEKMSKERESATKKQSNPADIPLRTQIAVPKERRELRRQAQELLDGKVAWSNGKEVKEVARRMEVEVVQQERGDEKKQ